MATAVVSDHDQPSNLTPSLQHISGSKKIPVEGYVPRRAVQGASNSSLAEQIEAFSCDTISGVILFMDVSGFTPLTEEMCKKGSEGAEKVRDVLSKYFSQLLAHVDLYGGDVVKFAGDALLVLFEFLPSTSSQLREKEWSALVNRAIACALKCAQTHYTEPNVSLKLKCALGSSTLFALNLGRGHRREFLIAGHAIEQAAKAELEASVGQSVISRELIESVPNAKELISGTTLPSGNILVKELKGWPSHSPSPPLPQLTDDAREYLLRYVPAAVRKLALYSQTFLREIREVTILFLNLQQLDFASAAECGEKMQNVVIIAQDAIEKYGGALRQFLQEDKGVTLIGVWGLPMQASPSDAKNCVKAAMQMWQQLHQFKFDASIGITTGRAFCGLVGGEHRHEYAVVGPVVNLAARLMVAVRSVVKTPTAEVGRILCDRETCQLVKTKKVTFVNHTPILVKGKSDKVDIFTPTINRTLFSSKKKSPSSSLGNSLRSVSLGSGVGSRSKSDLHGGGVRKRLVGRESQVTMLRAQIAEVVEKKSNKVVLLEGAYGTGKSTVWRTALEGAPNLSFFCCRPATQNSPFFAVSQMLVRMISPPYSTKEDPPLEARVAPKDVPYMALLNPLLGTQFPDTPESIILNPSGKREKLLELLVALLIVLADSTKRRLHTTLVIEDVEYMDADSAEVLRRKVLWSTASSSAMPSPGSVLRKDSSAGSLVGSSSAEAAAASQLGFLLLLTSVPGGGADPQESNARMTNDVVIASPTLRDVLKRMNATSICLAPLQPEDLIEVIRDEIGFKNALPEDVKDLILSNSNGNPLYAVLLIRSLLDRSMVKLDEEGNITLSELSDESKNSSAPLRHIVPTQIERIVLSRLDLLPVVQLAILRLSACVGMEIPYEFFRDRFCCHSADALIGITEEELRLYLSQLEEADFFTSEAHPLYREVYLFKHRIYRDVLYNSTGNSLRVIAHQKIGAFWESFLSPPELPPYYQQLAEHFVLGKYWAKAIEYLVKAGEFAFNTNSIADARTAFEKALEIATMNPEEISRSRLAYLHSALAELAMRTLPAYSLLVHEGVTPLHTHSRAVAALAGIPKCEALDAQSVSAFVRVTKRNVLVSLLTRGALRKLSSRQQPQQQQSRQNLQPVSYIKGDAKKVPLRRKSLDFVPDIKRISSAEKEATPSSESDDETLYRIAEASMLRYSQMVFNLGRTKIDAELCVAILLSAIALAETRNSPHLPRMYLSFCSMANYISHWSTLWTRRIRSLYATWAQELIATCKSPAISLAARVSQVYGMIYSERPNWDTMEELLRSVMADVEARPEMAAEAILLDSSCSFEAVVTTLGSLLMYRGKFDQLDKDVRHCLKSPLIRYSRVLKEILARLLSETAILRNRPDTEIRELIAMGTPPSPTKPDTRAAFFFWRQNQMDQFENEIVSNVERIHEVPLSWIWCFYRIGNFDYLMKIYAVRSKELSSAKSDTEKALLQEKLQKLELLADKALDAFWQHAAVFAPARPLVWWATGMHFCVVQKNKSKASIAFSKGIHFADLYQLRYYRALNMRDKASLWLSANREEDEKMLREASALLKEDGAMLDAEVAAAALAERGK